MSVSDQDTTLAGVKCCGVERWDQEVWRLKPDTDGLMNSSQQSWDGSWITQSLKSLLVIGDWEHDELQLCAVYEKPLC